MQPAARSSWSACATAKLTCCDSCPTPPSADSNQAERDLRPSKTQQKISGRARSETTTRHRYAVRGYGSTAARHGTAVFTAIRDALAGNPGCRPSQRPPELHPNPLHIATRQTLGQAVAGSPVGRAVSGKDAQVVSDRALLSHIGCSSGSRLISIRHGLDCALLLTCGNACCGPHPKGAGSPGRLEGVSAAQPHDQRTLDLGVNSRGEHRAAEEVRTHGHVCAATR